jgi:long-chain acyl-CoA synthetase
MKYWNDLLIQVLILEIKAKLRIKKQCAIKDLATIIYFWWEDQRSDAIHQNIVSNVLDSASRIPFEAGKTRALSFLPICHIFERMILYLYQYYGVSIYFGESIDKISDNLKKLDQLSLLLFQDFWKSIR